jgi:transcriptional regulator
MWTPRSFQEANSTVLHDVIEANSFAVLVSRPDNGGMVATHLPFLLDRGRGAHGTLIGHLARANPHWRALGLEALAVFSGAHAYISPAWYQDQQTVPTWNYVAVHAYGTPVVIHDPELLRGIVGRLTRLHEQRVGSTWSLAQADPIIDNELKAIVGFEMEISRLEGKFKLNQNRSAADRRGVAQALGASVGPGEREISRLMSLGLDAVSD